MGNTLDLFDDSDESDYDTGDGCDYLFSDADFIGSGTFGRVYKARVIGDDYTGPEFVAVKVLNFSANSEVIAKRESWTNAVKRLKKLLDLKHAHLVSYRAIRITKVAGGSTVKLIMDICTCDLATYLTKAGENNSFSHNYGKAVSCSKDIAKGLEYLHGQKIIHGDLKPGNILVKRRPNTSEKFLIGDLDNLVQMQENVTCSGDISHMQGTPRYMSPEMLRKFSQVQAETPGRKTDMWSLGCIMLDVVHCCLRITAKKLYKENTIIDIGPDVTNIQFAHLIMDGYAPLVSDDIPNILASIIRECFIASTGNRISAEDLLHALEECQVILLIGCEDFHSPRIIKFDPLTNTVEAQADLDLPKTIGPFHDFVAAEGQLVFPMNHEQRTFPIINLGEKKLRSLRLPKKWCCFKPIIVFDTLFFWDSHLTFISVNLRTGRAGLIQRSPYLQNRFGCQIEAVAQLDQKIYFAGQFRGSSINLERYDTLAVTWESLPDFPRVRSMFAMTCVNEYVYILGGMTASEGSRHKTPTATCIRWNTRTRSWEEMPSLKNPRYSHAACVIKNCIYICGGKNAAEDLVITIEVYDTKQTTGWTTVSLAGEDQRVLLDVVANLDQSGSITAVAFDRWNIEVTV
ncbi:uncharacterized protein LOC129600559 [Paramacrobiotus metropolitanus]|uniref:uncharacterized protein LOC129600559 n=1 Tax=Paramacrobiotus metropolitanus TaxID=2943436 RepID=UPI002445F306|nr:uncharacterized protein LOC129600559 [Paramacrobiotus metropolitanus]